MGGRLARLLTKDPTRGRVEVITRDGKRYLHLEIFSMSKYLENAGFEEVRRIDMLLVVSGRTLS